MSSLNDADRTNIQNRLVNIQKQIDDLFNDYPMLEFTIDKKRSIGGDQVCEHAYKIHCFYRERLM